MPRDLAGHQVAALQPYAAEDASEATALPFHLASVLEMKSLEVQYEVASCDEDGLVQLLVVGLEEAFAVVVLA